MGRIDAGSLRERVTLVTDAAVVSDGQGGFTHTGTGTQTTVWARVRPLKAGEKLALGQIVNDQLYEITIRRLPATTAKQRVTWKGGMLNVQAAVPDEYNEYTLLTCINGGQ